MTYTERINAYTISSARQRRGQMWVVFVALWGWALVAAFMCTQVLLKANPDTAAVSFAGAVFLGILTPTLVLITSAVRGRGPGIWLWVGFAVGGLIIAGAPLVVFSTGGSWDSEVFVLTRWRSNSGPAPLWLTARITSPLALMMALPGTLGVVRCLLARPRNTRCDDPDCDNPDCDSPRCDNTPDSSTST